MVVWFINQLEVERTGGPEPRCHASLVTARSTPVSNGSFRVNGHDKCRGLGSLEVSTSYPIFPAANEKIPSDDKQRQTEPARLDVQVRSSSREHDLAKCERT